ncbi:hypothetical protein AMS68_001633 [Peltaster fructicola]|uniref:Uncharacterized protein n=1 Tax=Peltaster fructicola TaxID=286661 RepID=A0A6H0XN35_9PEZI|nr:hypothetical protein AMS68_001633 [Peltaster fructicola]
MSYNNSTTPKAFQPTTLSTPGSGFGARGSRFNSKRLSVALPPETAPIGENSVGVPTPRTSRSHLLAGLRTQPKTPAVPASAPYHQTQHQLNGLAASQWANPAYNGYDQAVPQTATGANFDVSHHYAMRAGQQMYSLPEQVLAPPSVYEQSEGMDPNLLQQLQVTSLFLAQRQQELQQKLAALSGSAQAVHNPMNRQQQVPMTPQTPQYAQQQAQGSIEVQPGVYLVYNPAIQGYSYAFDQSAQLAQSELAYQNQALAGISHQFDNMSFESKTPPVQRTRSFTPPTKTTSPPSALEHVEPLPPPSANAFRRGHKKASSLAINPSLVAADGPKTASAASFGSQRAFLPQPPMTGTFGPGSARAGEHPMRQPRGPPPLEELTAAPTSKHDGSKNFATRQRRRALDNLMRAGTQRRGISRSSGGSPVSEREYNFTIPEDIVGEELASLSSSTNASRKMSPIGSEMKQKRGSQGSADGYFGLSSASSSECDDAAFKQPPTPATPLGAPPGLTGDRKKMMMGVLNAAEKRKSTFM